MEEKKLIPRCFSTQRLLNFTLRFRGLENLPLKISEVYTDNLILIDESGGAR
jgi:hypothetical protein